MWGSVEDLKRFHVINWEKICSPIQLGGLVVFNQANLGVGDIP